MPYKVEQNRFSGRQRLVYYATPRRQVLPAKGTERRRIVTRNGKSYHVTKGWRN
jgi:hypothetical protein